jgi:4-amino-4-deoxy-L-arabinose transferase-like glycosyltransferase
MTRARAGVLVVLVAAAAIRLASWAEIRGGPLPWLHRWTESDMAFFDAWAQAIVAGDVLGRTTPRPYHTGHAGVARAAHEMLGEPGPFDDAVGRGMWARWLGEHTYYQEPLYAYGLAAVFATAGHRVGAVVLVQAALGVVTAALVYALATSLFGVAAGLAAGLLAALYGPEVFHESLLLRDGPVVFVAVATLAAVVAALRSPRPRAWVFACGVLFGLGLLLKSSSALFSAVAALVIVRRLGRGAWPLAAGLVLVLVPLVARNVVVGAPPLALAASGPHAFLYYNAADYDPFGGSATSAFAPRIMGTTEGRWLPVVRETIATHRSAGAWLSLVGAKLAAAWHRLEVPDNASYAYWRLEAAYAARFAVEFWVIAPLFVAGMIAGVRRVPAAWLIVLLVVATLAANALFYTSSRLRLPVAIAMTPLAGLGLSELVGGVAARRWRRVALLSTASLVTALFVLRPPPDGHTGLRVADYGVANEITMHLARRRAAAGDVAGARALVARRLETEPPALRAASPAEGQSRLSPLDAGVAGSFAQLSALAATLEGGDDASAHAEHARLLRIIARQYAQMREGARP